MVTDFSKIVEILAEYYIWFGDEQELAVFNQYNRDGLHLAYSHSIGLSILTNRGEEAVKDVWNSLIETLGIEDKGFNNFDEIVDLVYSQEPKK